MDFFHLQNSLKGVPDIDALFLMTFDDGGALRKALVTFEAKRDEPILADQIKSQVALMAHRSRTEPSLTDIDFIVPVAAKTEHVENQRVIAIFEMQGISVTDGVIAYKTRTAYNLSLCITQRIAYLLEPKIAGI